MNLLSCALVTKSQAPVKETLAAHAFTKKVLTSMVLSSLQERKEHKLFVRSAFTVSCLFPMRTTYTAPVS